MCENFIYIGSGIETSQRYKSEI